MATQQDLRDLLHLMTTGRGKVTMMSAMGRVKALQNADLRSIRDIADADLQSIVNALNDEKAAKQLHNACKNTLKSGNKPKPTAEASSSVKRKRSAYEISDEPKTPQEIEESLRLPAPTADEEEIRQTVLETNRAPLVLAFAVTLLKYTMPEQPLSSRLSLAQAVVSANSQTKAASIGLAAGPSAEQEGWGLGQPKVKVMGREVHVLKRAGYEWRQPEQEHSSAPNSEPLAAPANNVSDSNSSEPAVSGWTVSSKTTLKQSTFVARSISVSSPSEARSRLAELLSRHEELQNASHNITAWRIQGEHGVLEDADDDGEGGGGRHLLQTLQSLNLVNVLLVVTRWYGGILLGPDRWRLITQVSQDALSQRLRVAGRLAGEAVWGLDLEAMRSQDSAVTDPGLPVHKPDRARDYILKAFATATDPSAKRKTGIAAEREKERNLGLLLAALDLLISSWIEHIGRDELDRRAWSWYVQCRPDVPSGASGWGAKGQLRLQQILDLRRKG